MKPQKKKRAKYIISFTTILAAAILFYFFIFLSPFEQTRLDGLQLSKDSAEINVYRDTWGVPHIYAPSVEKGLFAMGWAQAQDRPDELLLNMLRGMGELSSVKGIAALNSDKVSLMWNCAREKSTGRYGSKRPVIFLLTLNRLSI